MEVTKYNFHEELDNIVTAIEESTFLAIDTEFTGLDADGCNHNGPLDTPAERYEKLRNGSTDFLLIQFGLCAFKVDCDKQRYEAKPYNFYLFPSPFNRDAPDRRFLCQASSIDFLISHGFDFNKLFKEGIPYLSQQQEEILKTSLEKRHREKADQRRRSSSILLTPGGSAAKKEAVTVPDDQKEFVNEICEKIRAFQDSDDKDPLQLPSCNAFQRKLIYQTVEQKFPLVLIESKTGEKKERFLVLQKAMSAEELAKKELERQSVEMMELDIHVGFTKVMQAIAKSGKLVVGHNMFLDVLHSITHFHGFLPEDLQGFKSLMKVTLPRILDTKLLANTQPFKDFMSYTSLEEIQLTLKSKPFVPVKVETMPGFEKYDSGSERYHEAGYDAFLTGSCFVTMCRFLGTFQNPRTEFLLPTSSVVEPFVNKLFLMRIIDIPYLNLDGPDLEVNRDHVFHVTFPKDWKASDLHNLFEPYGDIRITWISEKTAYVSLQDKKFAARALEALSQETTRFHVISYALHHRNKTLKWTSSTAKRKAEKDGESQTQNKVARVMTAETADHSSKLTVNHEDLPKQSPGKEKKTNESKLFDESAAW